MNQCEIWLVDLNPSRGAELQKIRPCLVVGDNAVGKLPLRVVVPLTDWKSHYKPVSWLVEVNPSSQNGLQKDSAADCFQIRSVSVSRFIKRLGKVDASDFERIQRGLATVFSFVV